MCVQATNSEITTSGIPKKAKLLSTERIPSRGKPSYQLSCQDLHTSDSQKPDPLGVHKNRRFHFRLNIPIINAGEDEKAAYVHMWEALYMKINNVSTSGCVYLRYAFSRNYGHYC